MSGSTPKPHSTRDQLYAQAASQYAAPLNRLTRAWESNAEKQADLLHEFHLDVWQSLAGFECRGSLRTWIYPVAHNPAATYVVKTRSSMGESGRCGGPRRVSRVLQAAPRLQGELDELLIFRNQKVQCYRLRDPQVQRH